MQNYLQRKIFLKNKDIFLSALLIFTLIFINNFHANIASDKNFFPVIQEIFLEFTIFLRITLR